MPRKDNSPPPNFVFILADDLGYADLHCYGGRARCSPNLDKLAAEGLRFTNGYANSSVCSPSRFAIETGRYQHRLRGGFDEPISTVSPALGLPPEHPTVASLLRDAGYATALVGKWHLGSLPWFSPLKSGYGEFFGHRSGAVDFFSHTGLGGHDLWEGDEEVFKDGYLTDLLTDRAVDFVRRQSSGKPFLLSLRYNAPHWPWETRDDAHESTRIGRKIEHLDGGSVKTYLEMIRVMDEGIGRVLAALDDTGARDNTLVVFSSDNGGERFSDCYPLMGKKMDLLEGGIRVPYIVRWPSGGLPAGHTHDRLAIGMDWAATFLAAAGVSAHPDYPLDGIDLFGDQVERRLYWRMVHRNQKAVRAGAWKYLSIDGNEFLFDLSRDERERANMRYREPKKFEELRRAHFEWDASMPPRPDDAAVALGYTDDDGEIRRLITSGGGRTIPATTMPPETEKRSGSPLTGKARPMPAVFLGHGSPMNALEQNRYTASWRTFGQTIARPRAILVVSAHWYVNATAVTAMPRPRTIHDFYGFPQQLFEVDYPAPGSPELAEQVAEIVKPTHVGLDQDSWGIDHGTWSVLVHAFPKADVPVVQLSIHALRDFDSHFELGARLAPLREQGVLIVGSGNIVHNLRAIDWRQPGAGFDWARRFDDAARSVLTENPGEVPALRNHDEYVRSAPTPDHFIPLLYIAGLAGAANRPLESLIDGYAYGSISMAAYTLDAKCPAELGDTRPSAGLPDPAVVPPVDTNL